MKFYEELFEPFNKNKNIFHKKDYNINSKLTNIIQGFFTRISKHEKNQTKVTLKKKAIQGVKELNYDLLKSTQFCPKHIQDTFVNIKYCYSYEFYINNKKIMVNILLYKKEGISIYNNYIKKIILWLKFAFSYSNNNNTSFLLNICLSDYKKQLPNNETTILSPNECNTAVTYSCATKGECFIYRKEEWFKVLMHECMHALCLDFSGFSYKNLQNKIKGIFPIKSNFEVSETYSELWATILNNVFISYSLSKNKDIRFQYFFSLMQLEIYFGLFQMVKILDYMNIYNYEYLYLKSKASVRNVYKEDSNVFAYYILKTIILYNYVQFLHFCDDNNDDIINFNKNGPITSDSPLLNKFFDLLIVCYKDTDFIKSYNIMKKFFNTLIKQKKYNKLLKTMRMTSVEY